jgi:peptidoglycan-associated lipoprotein
MLNLSRNVKFACLAAVLALAACATKPVQAPAPASSPAVKAVESTIVPGSPQDFTINVGDTVHFDYDQYAVRPEDRAILQKQAAWLLKYPAVRVRIEGHCDERGTRDYNLALGARRAEAVKDYLASLGVPRARLDTISYGKERPVCVQSDESCWARNRRGVTTITSGAITS